MPGRSREIFLHGALLAVLVTQSGRLSTPTPPRVVAAQPAPPAPPSAVVTPAPPPPVPAPSVSAAPALERSLCPSDMVEIDGAHCTALRQDCIRHRKSWQCAEYTHGMCAGTTVSKHYCIDRYEYPNRKGELPAYMQSFYDAERTCKALGKRMCKSAEWTLACEGPEHLAFPYGDVRNAELCNIDKDSPMQDESKLFWPKTQQAELDRLDQREASGARETCKSAYGVYDLTGNVDEWTVNESGFPYRGALKGGNWGEYRNACRPATLGHDEGFHYYQTGFRCCADPRH